jgi:hypothetical protein
MRLEPEGQIKKKIWPGSTQQVQTELVKAEEEYSIHKVG